MKLKKYKIISFDYDGTLTIQSTYTHGAYSPEFFIDSRPETIKKLKQHKNDGSIIYIVTRRFKTRDSIDEILNFIKIWKLPIDGIFFTNRTLKVKTLIKLKVELHYDDDIDEIDAIKEIAPEIDFVYVN